MDGGEALDTQDPALERFARLVKASLGVPVALVSLLEDDEQVFPGAIGLPEPWQSTRRTPLSHSFCQHVVASGQPLVTADARVEPDLASNLAIPDLGVVAYAGMPLNDGQRTVGSLCAIDTATRDWDDEELRFLSDLAAACSSELALRASRRDADQARVQARHAATSAELLLALSEALAATTTVDDVITTTTALAKEHLDVVDVRIVTTTRAPSAGPGTRQSRSALLWVPLVGTGGPIGHMILLPSGPPAATPDEALIKTLAGYAASALERAQLLQERRDVATTLQLALLPRLPDCGDLAVRARYVPIASGNQVGGDWYDVVRLPGGVLKLVIGDVAGHDIEAAARMGQLRSCLRTLGFDRGEAPAATLTRLDEVILGLGLDLVATTQIAHLLPEPGGSVRVTWSSAGHPAPLLISPAGDVRILTDPPGLLLGIMTGTPRHDYHLVLESGATLLMYTDGLLERRGQLLADGQQALRAALTRIVEAASAQDVDQLLDTLVNRFMGSHSIDDCAVLAVHNPAP